MTTHFTPKSLAFYGVAIVAVVTLFSIVSAYGEANLKAPPRIDGSYEIADTELPKCLSSKPLTLLIQQSGIYLAGSLLPKDAAEQMLKSAEKRPLLNGHWRDNQLTLQGMVDLSPDCRDVAHIQATMTNAAPKATDQISLNGTFQFGVGATPIRFTASKQPLPAETSDESAKKK